MEVFDRPFSVNHPVLQPLLHLSVFPCQNQLVPLKADMDVGFSDFEREVVGCYN